MLVHKSVVGMEERTNEALSWRCYRLGRMLCVLSVCQHVARKQNIECRLYMCTFTHEWTRVHLVAHHDLTTCQVFTAERHGGWTWLIKGLCSLPNIDLLCCLVGVGIICKQYKPWSKQMLFSLFCQAPIPSSKHAPALTAPLPTLDTKTVSDQVTSLCVTRCDQSHVNLFWALCPSRDRPIFNMQSDLTKQNHILCLLLCKCMHLKNVTTAL